MNDTYFSLAAATLIEMDTSEAGGLAAEREAVALSALKNEMLRGAGTSQFGRYIRACVDSPLYNDIWAITLTEAFERLDSDAIRHHFVPRFALREFADRQTGQLSQLNTHDGHMVDVTPEAAASRRRLYQARREDGSADNRLEGYLALVEGHAAPIIQRLIAGDVALSDGDRATASFYFAIQMLRTPVMASLLEDVTNTALKMSAGAMFADLESFATKYREFGGDDLPTDSVAAKRDEILESVRSGRVRLTGANGAAYASAIEIAAEQAGQIFYMQWNLLTSENRFVTSDRAVAIHDPTPRFPWTAQALLSSENTETTIPLAPSACMMLRFSRPGLTSQALSDAEAELINTRTFAWATDYIFGASRSRLEEVAAAAEGRGDRLVGPRPHVQLRFIAADSDDLSFAEANVERGWPPQLVNERGVYDYVVFEVANPDPEQMAHVDEVEQARVRKRLGLGPDDPLPTPEHHAGSPLEIASFTPPGLD